MAILAVPRRNLRIVLLLVLAICGWIAMLMMESSQPPAQVMGEIPGLDKLAHFTAFGILGLLVCGLSFQLRPPPVRLFSLPLLFVSLIGGIEEGYQWLVPARSASFPDLLADICGAMFAIVLANRIARLHKVCKGGFEPK